MFSITRGIPIALIKRGNYDGELLCLVDLDNDDCCDDCSLRCLRSKHKCCDKCTLTLSKNEDCSGDLSADVELSSGKLQPLLKMNERSVEYIAGPSGSGKSTMARELIDNYLKINPRADVFIFSRTDFRTDPALKDLKVKQIKLDDRLLEKPIDITKDFAKGTLLLFDDCNTVQNEKIKKYLENLIGDILEVGRKLEIHVIITNHLIIPNEKKFARTILNEIQYLTVFPKSGSSQQIRYTLKTYFGLTDKQITKILNLNSRWVKICKNYPMYVLYDHGAYTL